ncbi:MAG: MFS transporter [Acidobacteriota bacterium]|nr:MFS transporter [Acidobacteriota bacterium]
MKRNGVLILLIALAIITFLDRISISVAGPRMQRDLGITPERWGWILGAFVLAYGIFEIPAGALGDRSGHKNVLTRIVLWWSAFTCFTGVATGFNVLLATRFLFGAGEAGAYPNIAGVIARWFSAAERARTQGFIWAASRFGGALSPLIVVPLQSKVGWRATFAILGAAGLLWALCWKILYRDLPGLEPEAAVTARAAPPWRELAFQSQIWLILAMYFCQAFGSWFYFGWFPVYLVKGAGFTEAQMGIFSALPFLLGATGSLAGGFLCDWLVLRLGLKDGRRLVGCAGLAASALLLWGMTLTRNKPAIVVLSSLGFGVADLMLPAAWATCMDISGRHAGVVTGSMNTAGQLGGFLCAVLFGYAVQGTGSYSAPVWMVAGMVMTGAILFSQIDATRKLQGID